MDKEAKLNKMDVSSAKENKAVLQEDRISPEETGLLYPDPDLGPEDYEDLLVESLPDNEGEPWGLEDEGVLKPDFSFLDEE